MYNVKLAVAQNIKNRKIAAEAKCDAVLNELRKDNEFRKLESDRDVTSWEIARLRSQNMPLGNQLLLYNSINKQIAERLDALGYTEEDLSPKYSCDLCGDTGELNGKPCKCAVNLTYKLLSEGSGATVTSDSDFANTDYNIYPDSESAEKARKTHAVFNKYISLFPSPNYKYAGLLGATGTGKSYCASVVKNALIKKGFSVYMEGASEINRLFLEYHLADIKDKKDIMSRLLDCDLLIIDDLGSENLFNNVTVNYLLELLNLRKQPLLITSNLMPDQISTRYGDRIYSRLFEKKCSLYVKTEGADLRLCGKS